VPQLRHPVLVDSAGNIVPKSRDVIHPFIWTHVDQCMPVTLKRTGTTGTTGTIQAPILLVDGRGLACGAGVAASDYLPPAA